MTRNVQIVLLCEDQQHEVFARRFLKKAGWGIRELRVEKAPQGRGAGEQYVRHRFPTELADFRRRTLRSKALIVLLDGDKRGMQGRLDDLAGACELRGIPVRQDDDRVFVLIPTRSIETWFAYLDGDTVDEKDTVYRRLSKPSECQRHVDAVTDMCQRQQLRNPAPPSLIAACKEYARLHSST